MCTVFSSSGYDLIIYAPSRTLSSKENDASSCGDLNRAFPAIIIFKHLGRILLTKPPTHLNIEVMLAYLHSHTIKYNNASLTPTPHRFHSTSFLFCSSGIPIKRVLESKSFLGASSEQGVSCKSVSCFSIRTVLFFL